MGAATVKQKSDACTHKTSHTTGYGEGGWLWVPKGLAFLVEVKCGIHAMHRKTDEQRVTDAQTNTRRRGDKDRERESVCVREIGSRLASGTGV